MFSGIFFLWFLWDKIILFLFIIVFFILEYVIFLVVCVLVFSIFNKVRKISSNIIEKFDFNVLGNVLDLEILGFILYLISDNLYCFGIDSWLFWLLRIFCLEYCI